MSNPTIPNNYTFSARSAHAMSFSYYLLFGVWMLAEGMADMDKGNGHTLVYGVALLSFASISLFFQSLFFSWLLALMAAGSLIHFLGIPLCQTSFRIPIWLVVMNLSLGGLFVAFCFSYVAQSRKKIAWRPATRLLFAGIFYWLLYSGTIAAIYGFAGRGWKSVSEHLLLLTGILVIYFLVRLGVLPGTKANIYKEIPSTFSTKEKSIFGEAK